MGERLKHLDFIITYIIVMMVFGLTASIFYPEQYSFGEEDYASFDVENVKPDEQEDVPWWQGIIDAIGGAWDAFTGILTFLWACVSFNIPMVPLLIRLFITVPFHIGMAYVIYTTLPGVGAGGG